MLDLSPDSKPLGWALALASQSYNHFSLGQVLVTISIAPFELTLRAERSQLLGTHLGNGNTPAARSLKCKAYFVTYPYNAFWRFQI